MKIIEIVESKHWLNTKTGNTASIYGAVPWTSEFTKQDWKLVSRGFTWRLDNGTTGLGRHPVKTMREALDIMHKYNNRG